MFLPLDRPWPWPTQDSETLEIYKLKPLRPRDPPTSKIGKAIEAVNHFISDKSTVNQLKLAAKGHMERISGNILAQLPRKQVGSGKKASEFFHFTQDTICNALLCLGEL